MQQRPPGPDSKTLNPKTLTPGRMLAMQPCWKGIAGALGCLWLERTVGKRKANARNWPEGLESGRQVGTREQTKTFRRV